MVLRRCLVSSQDASTLRANPSFSENCALSPLLPSELRVFRRRYKCCCNKAQCCVGHELLPMKLQTPSGALGQLRPSPCLPKAPLHFLTPSRTGRRQRVRAAGPTPASVTGETKAPEIRPVPKSIHDVDNGKILGFGADLGEDHPGFHDAVYKQRRVMIANRAKAHKIGEPIPDVEYTEEEVAVWGQVLRELKVLFPKYACRQFNAALPKLNFQEDKVPQLQEMADILKSHTGWNIRPVAGLMHPRDFLAGLAFKTFHSTQYMRHPSNPSYTPEPDVCHELIGHVPMLVDPAYAQLVQEIGIASLGADEKMIWHLTKVYWYTVEFGVVMEEGQPKAFGAGVLSSFGELEHMAQGRAALLPFDPFAKQPKMSYKDGYQKSYFALESFEDAATKIRALAATIKLPEELRGDASVA